MILLLAAFASEPTPVQERALLELLRGRLEDTEAIGRAAGLSLNANVAVQACEKTDLPALAAAERFLGAWQAEIAPLRELAGRVEAIAVSPTLVPLRSRETLAERDRLLDRVRRTEAAARGAAAHWRTQLAPLAKRCVPALVPHPGWPVPGIVATDDPPPLDAVLVTTEGVLCTNVTTPTPAGVALLETRDTCWAEGPACDCEPAPVFPGAVLGPGPAGGP